MKKIFKRPKVLIDLVDCAEVIAIDSLQYAENFLLSAETAFNQIATNPKIGTTREYLNPKLKGLRFWPVDDFEKFLIFYRERKMDIEIIRVAHGARALKKVLEKE